jgi:hypothetical protein
MIPMILAFCKTALKKPAFWAVIAIVGLASFAMTMKWRADAWKDRYEVSRGELADTIAAKSYWMSQALFAQSKFDSIRALGNYQTDTLWRERASVKIVAGKPETTWVNCPELSGKINIDTTRWVGDPDNPFGIRVAAELHWPDKYKAQNWLVIDALGWKKPQYSPARAVKIPKWGIGLGVCRAFGGDYGPGFHIRYNRTLVSYDRADAFKTRRWAGALRYEILRF